MGRLNHGKIMQRDRIRRGGYEDLTGGSWSRLVAPGVPRPVIDPLHDETMRRAAEHRQKRNHIKAMALKMKAKREGVKCS